MAYIFILQKIVAQRDWLHLFCTFPAILVKYSAPTSSKFFLCKIWTMTNSKSAANITWWVWWMRNRGLLLTFFGPFLTPLDALTHSAMDGGVYLLWAGDWGLGLTMTRSACELETFDHLHRPGSHQRTLYCLEDFQMLCWHSPGNHSTLDRVFLPFYTNTENAIIGVELTNISLSAPEIWFVQQLRSCFSFVLPNPIVQLEVGAQRAPKLLVFHIFTIVLLKMHFIGRE